MPFDLPRAAWYAILVVLVVAFVVGLLARPIGRLGEPVYQGQPLDTYQLAYLVDGEKQVVLAALTALWLRDTLITVPNLHADGHPVAEYATRLEQGRPPGPEAHRIEHVVHRSLYRGRIHSVLLDQPRCRQR
jgi:uncharacterized protein (TIGR04222 family)